MITLRNVPGPHRNQPVLVEGANPEDAQAAVVMVHGRGASAADILALAGEIFPINQPSQMTWIAPQAEDFSWYPYRFLEPLERNQPHLDSALSVLASLVAQLADTGIPRENLYLLGFSQGACLALEFAAQAARYSRPFGGVFGLSGGLIGPPGGLGVYSGSLHPTPVFLGCSNKDPHIPAWRVEESANIFAELGALVTTRLYPDFGHAINQDELAFVRSVLADANHNTQ